MMESLLWANHKTIFRSTVYWIYHIIILCFFSFLIFTIDVMKSAHFISYAYTLEYMTYLEITLFVLTFCISSYYAKQPYVLEDVIHVKTASKYLCRYISVVSMLFFICIVPICYILVSASFEKTQISYTLSSLIVILSRWMGIILLSHSIGFLVSTLIKTVYTYLLCIPFAILFSYLNTILIEELPISETTQLKLSQLLSLNKLFVSGMELDYTGLRLNTLLGWKILFILLASLSLISLLILCKTRRIRSMIATLGLLLCCGCSIMGYFFNFPDYYSSDEKLYVPKSDFSYYIESCSGDIYLDSTSSFKNIRILLKNPSEEKEIVFRLDSSFDIDSIQCNNVAVEYTQNGDYLIINLDDIETDTLEFVFNYSGKVSYYSNTQNVDIFTEPLSSALPPRFAFLPTLDNEERVYYDLTVNSRNMVISNLETTQDRNQYKLTGESDTICLFSGYFKCEIVENTSIYYAKYNKSTNYEEVFSASKKLNAHNQYNEKMTENPTTHKNCFLIYYFYDTNGFPISFSDYLIMNYGYIM